VIAFRAILTTAIAQMPLTILESLSLALQFFSGEFVRVNRSRRSGVHHLCLLFLAFSPLVMVSQATPPINEVGTFRLHKFEQPIGEETYTILRHAEGDGRLHAAELHHKGQYFAHVGH
jgi:hypothetical protein